MSTSSPTLSETEQFAAESLVRGLTENLRRTRERIVRVRWLTGAFCIGTVALATFATVALVDYFAELQFGIRAVALISLIVAIAGGVYWVYRQFIAQVTLNRTAAETERQVAEFGQRLRTTLDYSRGEPAPAQASPQLLAAMHRQTVKLAQNVDWPTLVDGSPAFFAFVAGALGLFGWGMALVLSPEYRTATARTFLLPAEYTRVSFAPQEQIVKFGESVEVSVEIEGRPVTSAIVRYRTAGSNGSWTVIDLPDDGEPIQAERDDDSTPEEPKVLLGGFTTTLAKLEQDVEFEVIAGPKPLPFGRITVLQPLKLERASAHITPPEYTHRPAQDVETLDLKVLEGSNVSLRLDLSRPASEGLLVPIAEKSKEGEATANVRAVPLAIVESALVANLNDLRESVSFTVSAKTADGMALDPLTVRVRVQLDKKPEIKFLAPQEQLMVTPTTEVPVIAEARDDLGLHRVGILYQVSGGTLHTLWDGSGEGTDETLRAVAQLMLEDHEVTFQDGVTYYAFAEDNYFGAPRRTTTELRFIDIRPFKIDYGLASGDDHEGESNDKPSASLEELIKRQRDNLIAGFAVREEQTLSETIAETLRRGELALKNQTEEFNQGIRAKVGPVPTLDEAIVAMGEAVDFLSNQDLLNAVEAEQEALGSLLKARENLRQLIKNSSSSAKSEAKKFDRQFKQKLRLPPKEKETAEKKLNEAKTQLEKLAERERKWGEQSQSCCNSPSSSSSSSSQSKSPSQSPSQSPSESQANKPAEANKPGEDKGQSPADQEQNPGKPSDKGSDAEKSESTSGEKPGSDGAKPTAEELAQAQEQIRKELADLKQQLAGIKESGAAAQQQADNADQSLQEGLEKLNAKDGEAVSRAAEESARQLEELADHLAALAARDFGGRLDEADRQAQQIAREQERLADELGAPPQKPQAGQNDGKSGQQSGQQSGDKSGNKPGDSGNQKPEESTGKTPGKTAGGKSQESEKPGSSDGQQQPADSGSGQAESDQDEGTGSRPGKSGKNPGRGSRSREQMARDQQNLAARTEMLGELLDRLRGDASRESADVRRNLDAVAKENPPGEIAGQMKQAAEATQSGQSAKAGQAAGQARDQAADLAKALGAARGAFAQPQLQELLALEEQLAQLMQQAQRAQEGQKGELKEKWNALEEKLDKLAKGDPRLANALEKLQQGPGGGDPNAESKEPSDSTQLGGKSELKPNSQLRPTQFQQSGEKEVPQGHYSWLELGDFHGPLKVAKVLQSKIQEAILAGALLDSDQPVPAEYKPLVEKYYKTLSDDLR